MSMTEPAVPTAPQAHALSAGVVVARRGDSGWRLLVLRVYRNWDFPKGTVEPDEEPLAAAIRETAEEAAISDLAFSWGEGYCETAPYRRGKVARYYLAETTQAFITLPVSPELGRPEHHEWRWVSLDEAERLLPPRLQPILAWVRKRIEV
ncbi:MAG: NUDIX domain-containing protein [Thiobacillus sp.]|nr:NUDIX domain-containing protein [Thiobacillus sp.]